MIHRSSRRAHRIALLLLALAAAGLRAGPRDELLRFVPNDVAFCLVVNDLRAHARAVAQSPFAEQLRESPLARAVRESNEFQQLAMVDEQIRAAFGIGWEEIRDQLLGDAVAFVYRPGPTGRPEQEEGLILLHARDPKLLAAVLDKINALQKDSGEIRGVEERTYDGFRYVCRLEKKHPTFYYLRDSVLIFTGQESMLRTALAGERALPAQAESAIARRLKQAGLEAALLALWVNPRAFDAQVAAKAAGVPPAEAALLKHFAVCWKAFDNACLGLTVERGLSVTLALDGRPAALPPPVQRFLAGLATPSGFWQHVPTDPLLAVAGRFDSGALVEAIAGFLNEQQRQKTRKDLDRTIGAALGRDVLRDVLPNVGPDWGFVLTAPGPLERSPLPRFVAALKLAPGEGKEPVDEAVVDALHSLALVGVLSHNRQHPEQTVMLKSRAGVARRTVRYLQGESALPPGWQPAFGLNGGFLLLASSPEQIEQFGAESSRPTLTREVPLARLSFRAWRDYLDKQGKALARVLAQRNDRAPDDLLQRLERSLAVLRWLERLDLSAQIGDNSARVTLRLQTDPPLRK